MARPWSSAPSPSSSWISVSTGRTRRTPRTGSSTLPTVFVPACSLTAVLRNADRLYLRIGLTRGWGEYRDRRFLQITGVHSVPDYLDGRCFADFAPVLTLAGS